MALLPGRIDGATPARRLQYERLVLVAPPRFLGLLRECLDAKVARMVAASLHKDASRASAEEIESMLQT